MRESLRTLDAADHDRLRRQLSLNIKNLDGDPAAHGL